MPRRSDSRSKMVTTAAQLFQRQGYAATGWRQVVAESGTPWGSQSHHFPEGKEQLAVDALAESGAGYERLLGAAFASGDPARAVTLWASAAAAQLEQTGWAEGCPVATVALELAHTSPAVGDACAEAFGSWRKAISEGLRSSGMSRGDADRSALFVLAAFEGALLLARADRDPAPLHAVGEEMAAWLRLELAASASSNRSR